MKKLFLAIGGCALLLILLSLIDCHPVNCLSDKHFTSDGALVDSFASDSPMKKIPSSRVKFFLEVSGSMNGLYRSNCQTEFRDNVFQIVSYYNSDSIFTLCDNNGKEGKSYSLSQFKTAIKSQGFPSMGSTSITDMMETVISSIDTNQNEVGVLISDMKFDPNGKDDIDYQLDIYTTDVGRIIADSRLAFCLVAAISKYYDSQGNIVANESPYYYLIMGKPENVAKVRDDISTILFNNRTYVENIETGMTYGGPDYDLEKVKGCFKMSKHPSFIGVEDSCQIKLNLNFDNYRWLIANESAVRSTLDFKALYGSFVDADSITINTNYLDSGNNLNRTVEASIYLKVKNLRKDCDVIEWSFDPCKFDTLSGDISNFYGANTWKDFTKTYSIDNFIKGMFRASNLSTCSTKGNYILVSVHD